MDAAEVSEVPLGSVMNDDMAQHGQRPKKLTSRQCMQAATTKGSQPQLSRTVLTLDQQIRAKERDTQ
jgi:hypothetical protein